MVDDSCTMNYYFKLNHLYSQALELVKSGIASIEEVQRMYIAFEWVDWTNNMIDEGEMLLIDLLDVFFEVEERYSEHGLHIDSFLNRGTFNTEGVLARDVASDLKRISIWLDFDIAVMSSSHVVIDMGFLYDTEALLDICRLVLGLLMEVRVDE